MNYKMLLKLDFYYKEQQLFDLLEEKVDMIKVGYKFNEIFKMEWVRLKRKEMETM